MKKQTGYFLGGLIFILDLVIYAIPFSIASVVIGLVTAGIIKNISFLAVVEFVLSLLVTVGMFYFAVKRFTRTHSVPSYTKLVTSILFILFIIDFGISSVYTNDFSIKTICLNILEIVVVYFVAMYSIKKNTASVLA